MEPSLKDRVDACLQAGDIPGALRQADEAVARDLRNADALKLRASLRAFGGDWAGMIADFKAVLLMRPDARFDGALAAAYAQSGDAAAALSEYDRELKLTPDDAVLLSLRGRLKLKSGDSGGAVGDLEAVARAQPGVGGAWAELAAIEAGLGRFKEALAHLDEAIRVSPDDWRHRLDRGILRAEQGRFQQAEADLDSVIFDIAPLDACRPFLQKAFVHRGWARFCQGNVEAEGDIREALRLDPGDPKALCLRGAIRCFRREAGAREDLDDALRRDPGLALAYGFRGDYFLEAGDKASALRDYRKSVELAPSLRAAFAKNIARAERA